MARVKIFSCVSSLFGPSDSVDSGGKSGLCRGEWGRARGGPWSALGAIGLINRCALHSCVFATSEGVLTWRLVCVEGPPHARWPCFNFSLLTTAPKIELKRTIIVSKMFYFLVCLPSEYSAKCLQKKHAFYCHRCSRPPAPGLARLSRQTSKRSPATNDLSFYKLG